MLIFFFSLLSLDISQLGRIYLSVEKYNDSSNRTHFISGSTINARGIFTDYVRRIRLLSARLQSYLYTRILDEILDIDEGDREAFTAMYTGGNSANCRITADRLEFASSSHNSVRRNRGKKNFQSKWETEFLSRSLEKLLYGRDRFIKILLT